jgi:hypothetical protein
LLRAPLRKVFVPDTHYLVHAATVHTARQAAHLAYEVTKERWAWPHFKVVDEETGSFQRLASPCYKISTLGSSE